MMNYQEQQDYIERLAYSKGFTYGFWVGVIVGAVGALLLAVLADSYVPL